MVFRKLKKQPKRSFVMSPINAERQELFRQARRLGIEPDPTRTNGELWELIEQRQQVLKNERRRRAKEAMHRL